MHPFSTFHHRESQHFYPSFFLSPVRLVPQRLTHHETQSPPHTHCTHPETSLLANVAVGKLNVKTVELTQRLAYFYDN